MRLSRKSINELKRNSDNKLFRYVCSWVSRRWVDYSDKTYIFRDVLEHGCQTGIVSELIYYSDTVAFYKRFQDEINTLLTEVMSGTGIYNMRELFGKNWDEEDPLALDCYNQNMLAWFGFEETLRNIGLNFEKLENYL